MLAVETCANSTVDLWNHQWFGPFANKATSLVKSWWSTFTTRLCYTHRLSITTRDLPVIGLGIISAADMLFLTISVIGTACMGSWYKYWL